VGVWAAMSRPRAGGFTPPPRQVAHQLSSTPTGCDRTFYAAWKGCFSPTGERVALSFVRGGNGDKTRDVFVTPRRRPVVSHYIGLAIVRSALAKAAYSSAAFVYDVTRPSQCWS
jgi:hypothetical protein